MSQIETIELIDKTKVYNQVLYLKKYFIDKWWNINKEFPTLMKKTNYWYKRKKEKETNEFIDKFIKSIHQYPENEDQRKIWKENINIIFDDFISKSALMSMQDKNILLNQGMLETTKEFVYEGRKFDLSMNMDDIGQAMRNVWIMNIISLLVGKKAQLTPSIFSYSMLYPYTDNYLDNIRISIEEKIKLSDRFEKRLKGYDIEPKNNYEKSIFRLVSKIENEYERSKYPQVYESLISIHKAQIKSLLNQGKKTGPYEKDILGISVEKGGTSVLADGYLVKGKLTQEEAKFFFGYGVLLQICDDLQDAESDLENRHMTIVSQIIKKWPLDNITNALINFTYELLENTECFNCSNVEEMKELIRKNCIQLILFSVAKNKKLYSKQYYNNIKQYFPYRGRYIRKLYKKIKKKFSKLSKNYSEVEIQEILMEALRI